ncbi:MAG: hypothetical protein AUI17_05760 [Acidobacteriales bacterium 13_2_20CM_2_55_5]|nr:MAG: hypothetical protein AUI17_05760 [Acidobacteriales bacterium 13_2_20CM_2_55_5]
MSAVLLFFKVTRLWRWLRHLGGPGLILLGIADNSVVPLPGSMDVLTIWLAAHQRSWWLYYAAMATVGALIGGYITYGLARKGGNEAFERKLPKKLAAGALQYSKKKFLGALALGRGIRFTIVAGLGAHYGNHIVRFFAKYYEPALYTLIGLAVVAGIFTLVGYLRYRRKTAEESSSDVAVRRIA